jgi:hypothetical protein
VVGSHRPVFTRGLARRPPASGSPEQSGLTTTGIGSPRHTICRGLAHAGLQPPAPKMLRLANSVRLEFNVTYDAGSDDRTAGGEQERRWNSTYSHLRPSQR